MRSNPDRDDTSRPGTILLATLLISMAIPFGLVDMFAGLVGSSWRSPFFISATLTGMVCGFVIGMVLGIALDARISSIEGRRRARCVLWAILAGLVVFYALVRPACIG